MRVLTPIGIACLLFALGCTFSNEDLFYKSTAGYDCDRLPLIKPLEAINARTGPEMWGLYYPPSFKIPVANGVYGSIGMLKKINVSNGNIYGYANYYSTTDAKNNTVKVDAYFLINPAKDQALFTIDKEQYLGWLKDRQLNPDSVYVVQDLFDVYAKTNSVPWHP